MLEDNVEAMRLELRAGDFEAAARLDFEFHRHILVASGNQAMLGIVTAGADIFLESQKMPFIRAARVMETWQEHRKILRALSRHASGPAQRPSGPYSWCGTAHRHRVRVARQLNACHNSSHEPS